MAKAKIDLNAPAFGNGAQKIEDVAEETEVEPVAVVKAKEDTEEESDEESKVPYSRFKKFHEAAKEAAEEAAYWKAKAQSYDEREPVRQPEIDLQDEAYKLWLENFGDTEASRKAWQNQLKITQTLEERALVRAEERARETVRNERYEETERTEKNVEKLDENFEDLGAFIGRDLSEKEQSAILDIVDDYTPKDAYGNYAGELLPFDKAWEIYELKTNAAKAPKVQSRNNVAALGGSQSEGEAEVTIEKDKAFNPLDWNAYKRRI